VLDWSQRSQQTLLVLSQVYAPDPAALGQYMHDVAREMVRRGTRVIAIAADRGYDDPSERYPGYELLDGVHVLRVPLSSFGKSNIPLRLLGGSIFIAEAVLLATRIARVDHVLVSTSPPMCSLAALALNQLRRVPTSFWAMDINPDQIVATGKLDESSVAVRGFDAINRRILQRAQHVITLDTFMADRVEAKWPVQDKLSVIPLWPLVEPHATDVLHECNPFRIQHQLQDKLVLMYSGNISPVNPVRTLLDAARELRDDPRLLFMFIGGGAPRAELERYVRDTHLTNVRFLPYQPHSTLHYSLSAADMHIVSIGNAMVGIVHPCKVYGAMAVGRPLLVLGPEKSHLGEIVHQHHVGFQLEHGDVRGAVTALRRLLGMPRTALEAMGQRAQHAASTYYNSERRRAEFCDLLMQDQARGTGSA
jgi:glycosyltransferase involved in cell wall biosynthesis